MSNSFLSGKAGKTDGRASAWMRAASPSSVAILSFSAVMAVMLEMYCAIWVSMWSMELASSVISSWRLRMESASFLLPTTFSLANLVASAVTFLTGPSREKLRNRPCETMTTAARMDRTRISCLR